MKKCICESYRSCTNEKCTNEKCDHKIVHPYGINCSVASCWYTRLIERKNSINHTHYTTTKCINIRKLRKDKINQLSKNF